MNKNIPIDSFPFKSQLNLSSLVEYWENNLNASGKLSLYPADHILELIKNAPELKQPIEDLAVIEKHQKLVGLLMSAIIPSALVDTELSAGLIPFNFRGFFATEGFKAVLPLDKIREDIILKNQAKNMTAGKVVKACALILNKFYNTKIEIDDPMLVTIPDTKSGLDRIYKVDFSSDFVDVINVGEIKPISEEDLKHMMNDLYNTELWLQHIDSKNFIFQGFNICRLVEVTVEEMISSIKYDLLKKDAVTCPMSFETIQQKIRSIFRLPEMKLGLSFFDVDNNVISNQGLSNWNSFMMPCETEALSCDYFIDSIYDNAFQHQRPIIIEDLEKLENKTHVEKNLLRNGIKNVAIAPLIYDEKVIGMLELGTPYVGKLNPVSANKMESVLPMFTAAVRRVLEDMKTEVRAIIQEECTAIHPSVEWRFLEEGYKIIGKRNSGSKVTMSDIVFPGVYPLFGLSDIRNSSQERNAAIQQDLVENLKQAKKVISAIRTKREMPILSEIKFRIDNELKKISKGLNSGDETSVLDFLKNEIVPAFNHFKIIDEEHKDIIDRYEEQLDPELGVIYNKRKNFEESLTKINETISSYLEVVEEEAQQIFPHYFEKYKTDGVEYNIYLGQSMVKDKTFDTLYLNNFRLWQLITMCEIANKVDELKPSLSTPLDITQLILVHGEPLSIKFRKDEKHFDVDGAYNIRYEIVKKRIDKAFIKDTTERLTQPGKVAIVYTQQKEADEYLRYIKYLQSIDYLKDEVEWLELEELQGAHGLKAIRVSINFDAKKHSFGNEVIQSVLQNINQN
jgi:phage terminase Nu1 subunit (DNA packaging protein)